MQFRNVPPLALLQNCHREAVNPAKGIPLETPFLCFPAVVQFLQASFKRQLVSVLRVTHRVTQNTDDVTQSVSSKSHSETAIHRVNCTLTPEEYKTLRQQAQSLHIRHTTLLKDLAFSHLEGKYLFSSAGEKAIRALTTEIRRIGVNINQIAKHANTFQKLRYADLQAVHQRIDKLEQVLNEAIVYFRKP